MRPTWRLVPLGPARARGRLGVVPLTMEPETPAVAKTARGPDRLVARILERRDAVRGAGSPRDDVTVVLAEHVEPLMVTHHAAVAAESPGSATR